MDLQGLRIRVAFGMSYQFTINEKFFNTNVNEKAESPLSNDTKMVDFDRYKKLKYLIW